MSVNKEALKYYTDSLLEYTQPYIFSGFYTGVNTTRLYSDSWLDNEAEVDRFVDFCDRANNDGAFKAPLILMNARIKKPATNGVTVSSVSYDDCSTGEYYSRVGLIDINFPLNESSSEAVSSNYICYRINSTSPAEYIAIGLSNNLSQTEYLNLKSTLDSLHNGGIS